MRIRISSNEEIEQREAVSAVAARAGLSPSPSSKSIEALRGDLSGTFGACSTSFCPGAVSGRGRLFASAADAADGAAIVAAQMARYSVKISHREEAKKTVVS